MSIYVMNMMENKIKHDMKENEKESKLHRTGNRKMTNGKISVFLT